MAGRIPLIVIALAALATSCSNDEGQTETQAAAQFSAATQVVSSSSAPQYTELTGTLEGRLTVPVASKLMNQILYMGYEEGDRVAKGDLLARLDDSEISAMQLEAAAFRAEAEAAMGEVEAGVSQGRAAKAQAEAALAQALASRENAAADARRYSTLADAGVVAPAQAEKYQLAFEVAEEGVALAEASVEQAQGSIDQARSKAPQVLAKQDQAAARGAQAASMLQYAVLKSPIDGVVTRRLADPGQLSVPGQPLYLLADDSGFQVRINAPERIASGFALGDQIDVLLDGADAPQRLAGTISVVSAAANPATHTVLVEISLPAQAGLVTGMFARVLVPGGAEQRLLIPESALVREGDTTAVWRVSSAGMLSLAPVEATPDGGGMLQIVRGLSAGDRIVTEPQLDFYPGARIGANHSGS